MTPEETRANIGGKIRELRKDRNILQSQLSEKTGIAHNRISEIESGKYSAGVDVLATILNGLGAHLEVVKDRD